MGIFRSKKAPTAVKGQFHNVTWPDDPSITSALVRDQEALRRAYSRDPVAAQLVAAATSLTYTYARRNARFLAGQPCRLYRKGGRPRRGERSVDERKHRVLVKRWGVKVGDVLDAGDLVEVTSHPILDYLACPHPYWPGSEMEEIKFFFKQITGNAYETFDKSSLGRPIAWPLYPQYTVVQADPENMVRQYFFGRNESKMVELDPERVIHWRNGMDKSNPLMGGSDIAHILPEINLVDRVTLHDLAFVKNGNRPDTMLSVDASVTNDQMEEAQKRVTRFFRDMREAGVAFVARGLTPHTLTTPPKDLRTPEQLAVYERRIRQALGWPEAMADSNASTYAAAKVADGQLGQYYADKLAEDAAQKTLFLCPHFDLDPDQYQFVYDSPIAEDEEAEERRFIALAGGAVLTPNEVREALGYDPSPDENAGKLWFNGMPLGGAAPASPFGGLFGGGGLTDSRRDAPDEPDPEPEPEPTPDAPDDAKALDLWAAVKGLEAAQWRVACPVCSTKDDDDYAGTDILRQLAERYLNPIRSAALDILTDAQAEALTAWANATDPDLSLFASQATEELAKVLQPLVEDAIKAAMLEGDGSLTDDAFSVVPERAVRFLDTYTPQLADDLMGTTGEMARVAVQRGLEEGWSIDKIKNEMEGVPAYRAEAIARTEVNRAAHEGLIEGWKEVGITTGKWVTSPGVRASHAAIGAKAPRPFGEAWVKAGETLAGDTFDRDIFMPPAGVNCRCGLQPVFEEGE